MVEVAVIGAGAAGLVSARQLLKLGYRTHIFERRSTLGGAWQASPHPGWCKEEHPCYPPQMWESLTPNLSKYTCCFSDFPWPESTPMFPSLSQMNQYLHDYAEQYILNDDSLVSHYGCTVTHVGRSTTDVSPSSSSSSYRVQWRDDGELGGAPQSQQFDGVVIATGFFSQPYWPVTWENSEDPSSLAGSKSSSKIIHSSQYRSWKDFSGNGTVAVIGGSFSAQEIAAELAYRRTAPSQRVVQILGDRAPYVVPRNLMVAVPGGGHPEVVPIDFALYRRKQNGLLTEEAILLDSASCQQRHSTLRQWIGTRKIQQAAARGYVMSAEDTSEPPGVSISDSFLDLVVDGRIEVRAGRVQAIRTDPRSSGSPYALELTDGTTLSNIDHVITCTGYRCGLDFLDPEILHILQYDANDTFVPILACYDTLHPQLPYFGLVGMYKGPYFGVMELQAQLLARKWMLANGSTLADSVLSDALRDSETRRYHVPKAQFPHFDYIGFMDHLSRLLDLVPTENQYGYTKGNMVTPLLCRSDIYAIALEEYKRTIENDLRSNSEHCISHIALSAMLGQWNFDRIITDTLTQSKQHITGTVNFSWQGPNLDALRYREDGVLVLPNGNQLDVFREYEYKCRNGNLEIDFVENGEPTYLFLSLQFTKYDQDFWIATSDHLCIQDLYKGTFHIRFDGLGASEIRMTYHVKGPKKDYESVTTLRPIL